MVALPIYCIKQFIRRKTGMYENQVLLDYSPMYGVVYVSNSRHKVKFQVAEEDIAEGLGKNIEQVTPTEMRDYILECYHDELVDYGLIDIRDFMV